MEKEYHGQITEKAVKSDFSDRAFKTIIKANLNQDALLNLLKGHFHFDANGYEGTFRYLQRQEDLLIKSIKKGRAEAAWRAFGRIIHAVQDFYSHTNYIKLWLDANPGFNLEDGHSVPPLDEKILNSTDLIAARVYYPLEALSIFPVFNPWLKRILPADSHVNMNLDAPESGRLFPFAISAAINRTSITLEVLCQKIVAAGGQDAVQLFFDNKTR